MNKIWLCANDDNYFSMFIRLKQPYKLLLSFSLILSFLTGCSQNDSQREFEREAFNLASGGITQTNDRGEIIDGNRDPDDWRIAPFFLGLVIVDPAFPNPVQSNGRAFINIQVTGIDAVSGLRAFVLYDTSNIRFLHEELSSPLMTGLYTIPLNPLSIAQFQENPQGIYRIILEDFKRNIITYGDIQIQ